MLRVEFTKMQGAGNDFVVINATERPFALDTARLKRLADRHFGVGCDQVLVVEPSPRPDTDFRYRIFNCDGGEVEQCGNGARCFVRFVHDKGLTSKQIIRVETLGGVIVPRLESDGEVSVDMGAPVFEHSRVPFAGTGEAPVQSMTLDGVTIDITVLSMGNPHAVQLVSDVERALVDTQGPRIEHHRAFPRKVNAGFMQIVDRGRIRLRVWERGAGETLSCGTGACAAVVSGILRGLLDGVVCVETRGGTLTVSWAGGDNAVWMKGPAVTVFEGEIEL